MDSWSVIQNSQNNPDRHQTSIITSTSSLSQCPNPLKNSSKYVRESQFNKRSKATRLGAQIRPTGSLCHIPGVETWTVDLWNWKVTQASVVLSWGIFTLTLVLSFSVLACFHDRRQYGQKNSHTDGRTSKRCKTWRIRRSQFWATDKTIWNALETYAERWCRRRQTARRARCWHCTGWPVDRSYDQRHHSFYTHCPVSARCQPPAFDSASETLHVHFICT